MDSDNLINNLSIVREYFSHNMRTSTAMVVATVSIFKFGLSDDTDNLTDMIMESSYFLDMYDKGMEIFFHYVLGKPIRNDREQVDPIKITNKLIENLSNTIKEQGVKVELCFEEMTIPETNSYLVKTLLELIIAEEIKKCDAGISIRTRNNTFSISKEKGTDYPEIYGIFAVLLSDLNIEFQYDEKNIALRFK